MGYILRPKELQYENQLKNQWKMKCDGRMWLSAAQEFQGEIIMLSENLSTPALNN